MRYRLKVYYWNPNGTNDIEIVNCKTLEVVETVQEALFGLKIDGDFEFINPKFALKYIAVSPVSDGSEAIRAIKSCFKKAGAQ